MSLCCHENNTNISWINKASTYLKQQADIANVNKIIFSCGNFAIQYYILITILELLPSLYWVRSKSMMLCHMNVNMTEGCNERLCIYGINLCIYHEIPQTLLLLYSLVMYYYVHGWLRKLSSFREIWAEIDCK